MSRSNSTGNRASAPGIQSRGSGVADAREKHGTRLDFTPPGFARNKYRVLLAHDLSARSQIALVRAAQLARERCGQLTILHVIDSALSPLQIDGQRAHATSWLKAEARRWLGHRNLSFRIDIGVGDIAGTIAARAQAHDVDLVVAGRRRRRPFAGAFVASTVDRLLSQIQRPALIIGSADQSPYRRLLIPVDVTDAAAARIRFAASLLPRASLHLHHAYKRHLQDYVASGPAGQEPRRALLRWIETLELGDRRPLVTIANGDSLALLRQELARQKTDLMVSGSQVYPGAEHPPFVRAREAIFRSSPCDVLVVPMREPEMVARAAASWRGPSTSALRAQWTWLSGPHD
jgi:universal stress protein E